MIHCLILDIWSCRVEVQGTGVDAITLTGGFGAVVEDVSEVGTAVPALNLRPDQVRTTDNQEQVASN